MKWFIAIVVFLTVIGCASDWKVSLLIGIPIILIAAIVNSIKKADEKERLRIEREAKMEKEYQEQERLRALAIEKERARLQAKSNQNTDEKGIVEVPFEINGCPCAYNYEKVYFDLLPGVDPAPYLGRKVRLYDLNGEILVKVGKTQIGTMRDNRLSDMVSDWLDRGDPIYAIVTHTNDDPPECAFDLYLYKKDTSSDE